jgi:phosphatidylserine decarboxylase
MVNPQAINEECTLDVFCENKRNIILASKKETGSPVAIIAIGAMLVGSIVYVGDVDKTGA